MAGKISNYQTSALLINLGITLFPFETSVTSFLSPRWNINLEYRSCPGVSYFYGAPVHMKLIFFSPVNLSYVHLIIRPAKEPRRVEGKFFLLYNILIFDYFI